jgi:serine/threonine protein kinase
MSELVIKDKFMYSLADRKFYETMSRYQAKSDDFCKGLKRRLPSNWKMHRHEVWTHCTPPEIRYPDQGWKIHLSATPAHAPAILATAAQIFVEASVPFKFLSDRMILSLSLGKRWSRGGAGKFMAAYPESPEQCQELLEKLHQATIGYNGPFILSDRRYRDSKVVYYRYGGLKGTRQISHDGTRKLVISDQEGNYISDDRVPFFQLPKGIVDPFVDGDEKADDGEPGTLKKGRYKIESVLVFSNSGGVYLATDRQTDTKVVIKEARPYTNVSTRGLDAVQLLKKEHRVLCCMADTGFSPKPIDFFFDWEHAYLVEEFLESARPFRSHMGGNSLALRTRPTQEDAQSFMTNYCEVFRQLTVILKELHERQIVFGDLSMANVMVTKIADTDQIKVQLIDFEGSHEADVDVPAHLFTPGFSSAEFAERGVTARDDDVYALGSLMLAGLFPINSMLVLDRGSAKRFLDAFSSDFGLPSALGEVIEGLMSKQENRPSLQAVLEVLQKDFEMPEPIIRSSELAAISTDTFLKDIMSYVGATADYSRADRLFPADPEVFNSNSLSLAHGACGIAFVQKKVLGYVPYDVLNWIEKVPVSRSAFSPGLYSGLSGIAWFWLELGEDERAKQTLKLADEHPYLEKSPDLFNGAAGWGMTQLRFYRKYGDSSYLDAAVKAGEMILEAKNLVDDGAVNWRSQEGLSASFAHGSAGICLFLLYLYLATDRKEFLQTGKAGLAWVISQGIENPDGGLSWVSRDTTPSYTPYWRWGSSGIARTLLRYWHVTGDDEYANVIDKIIIDSDRKYTIFPGYFFGLAGIGELFLDLARFDRWKKIAIGASERLLSGCTLFAIKEEPGLAFPGESLSRISCDFGTGGAGVALVLHRYMTRCGASFMVDDLIPGWSVEDR